MRPAAVKTRQAVSFSVPLEIIGMAFKTQYSFRLPRGYVDESGNVHRDGVMRLATARDEILPLQDYRVQSNRAYLVIVLLSRVVIKLGEHNHVYVDMVTGALLTEGGSGQAGPG